MDDYGDHDISVDSGGHWVHWVVGFHRPFTKGASQYGLSNPLKWLDLKHSTSTLGAGVKLLNLLQVALYR